MIPLFAGFVLPAGIPAGAYAIEAALLEPELGVTLAGQRRADAPAVSQGGTDGGAMRLALTLVLLLVIPAVSAAQARTLVPLGGATVIIVWKNDKARSEGADLLAAGVGKSNPALLVPLVACVVPSGTQAIKTDGGFFTSDILVTSGTHSGCRGNIANEHLGKRP